MNETIIPVDHKKNGPIVDNQINAMLVQALPPGVRLTAIFDSCHSGSALDLPYRYDCEDMACHVKKEGGGRGQKDVVMFAGSKDHQKSMDTKIAGEATGACSFAFIDAVSKSGEVSYGQLLTMIRDTLKKAGFTQHVQVSTGFKLDMNAPFHF